MKDANGRSNLQADDGERFPRGGEAYTGPGLPSGFEQLDGSQKMEEARISDAMDKKRISNAVIAEAAAVPILPADSPWLLLSLGGLLATPVSAGSAFVADYLDPSFHTPDEVLEYLDIPVLAAMPENAHPALAALPPSSE